MDPVQKECIFLWVSEEFSVTSLKKHYYCSKVSLENLKFHLKSFHGSDSAIFVCIDHVVVKAANGVLFVYLLSSHSSRRCADFLHHWVWVFFFPLQLTVPEGMFSGHLYTYSRHIVMCRVGDIHQGFCWRENSYHLRDHRGREGKFFPSMGAQFAVFCQNWEIFF